MSSYFTYFFLYNLLFIIKINKLRLESYISHQITYNYINLHILHLPRKYKKSRVFYNIVCIPQKNEKIVEDKANISLLCEY